MLLFVFWYCHKRGRETRLEQEEKDRLAAEDPNNSNLASSASSIASDVDSIFASNANVRGNGESSRQGGASGEGPQPPLVISDERATTSEPKATVEDMPSVKDLPSPSLAK